MKKPRSKDNLPAGAKRPAVQSAKLGSPVGSIVRVWRRRNNITLDELAASTNLTKGYLSRLENGLSTPSVGTVMQLSRLLGISVAALFGEQVSESDVHIVRKSDHARLGLQTELDGKYRVLSPIVANPHFEVFLCYPEDEFVAPNRAEHAGEEMIYVLSGEIEVRLADRSERLSQGDYLQFSGHIQHQIRRTSKQCDVLIVIDRNP